MILLLKGGRGIPLGKDSVRRRTSAHDACIYIDHAMPEHIARALVGDLVLSLSPGRFVLVHSSQLHFCGSECIALWCGVATGITEAP